MTPSGILVTGAGGFIGSRLCRVLVESGCELRAAVRDSDRLNNSLPVRDTGNFEYIVTGGIGPDTQWSRAMQGIDTVIHLAAKNSDGKASGMENIEAFRYTNVQATENLARQAASAGVRRLIYLSSIKVNGECSSRGQGEEDGCFTEQDRPSPRGSYALSKWEAEQRLGAVSSETGLEVVIVRPPLVYGPGVSGNFLKLMRLADSGMWLPLGGLNSVRSFIFLDNLVDFIRCCLEHPRAAGNVFLVSDMEDISTSELLHRLSVLMGRSPHLFSIPGGLIRAAGRFSGKSDIADRLLYPLKVDISRAVEFMGWRPPVLMQQGLQETVAWFRGM